jgi:hypothetical protein
MSSGIEPSSGIDPATLAAYRETEYHVHGESPCTLRVGEPSSALAALHARHGVSTSGFVTACNPRSEQRSAAENAARQQRLEHELAAAGIPFVRGEGRHPDNGWPPEPSLLVLGLTLDDAEALGRRWQQNAMLHCGADAVPRLVLLR